MVEVGRLLVAFSALMLVPPTAVCILACCRPHEPVPQEQKASDPVHTPPEAQPITSIHALLSWEPGALPFDEMLRGTTPLQASCIADLFHHPCRQLLVATLDEVYALSSWKHECIQLCMALSAGCIFFSQFWAAHSCHKCVIHLASVPVQAAPNEPCVMSA